MIPAYNREKFIERAVKSVLNQTYNNLEILVIDDGSKDNTVKIVKEIVERNPQVRLFEQKNSGAQVARNRGIKEAKNEWIAFLDSDDEWLPNKLERQLKELEKVNFNPFTVVHSKCIVNDVTKPSPYVWDLPVVEGEAAYAQVLANPGPMFQGMLTSKEAFEKIGFLDERVPAYQEWDTSTSLARYCQFIFINEPLFVYYLHESETISKSNSKAVEGYGYIIRKNKNEIRRVCGDVVYKNHLAILYNMCMNFGFTEKANEVRGEIVRFMQGG